MPIGSTYDTSADPATLDGYLKGCLKRATAGWVAVVLEGAGIVDLDRSRPARVRLLRGLPAASTRRGSPLATSRRWIVEVIARVASACVPDKHFERPRLATSVAVWADGAGCRLI